MRNVSCYVISQGFSTEHDDMFNGGYETWDVVVYDANLSGGSLDPYAETLKLLPEPFMVMVVWDSTNKRSLENMRLWIEALAKVC